MTTPPPHRSAVDPDTPEPEIDPRRRDPGLKPGSYQRDPAHQGARGGYWERADLPAKGDALSDRIVQEVHRALAQETQIDAAHIKVSVSDRHVILGGTVASAEAKRLAAKRAGEVAGVEQVQDNLQVGRSNPTQRDD
ncbi:BON domain-containing protein [Pararhodobacter oceanensis]|nr:BON domain-containing protein [Pararhodobacter oceanensis]